MKRSFGIFVDCILVCGGAPICRHCNPRNCPDWTRLCRGINLLLMSAKIECNRLHLLQKALSPKPRRAQNRLSEVVVYTTTAVAYRPRLRQSGIFRPIQTSRVTPASQIEHEDSCKAWAQIHVFAEMERGSTRFAGGITSVLGNFRIVAWILDSGAVVLNGPLNGNCQWVATSEEPNFRQFTGVEGQTAGFRFCSAVEADECSQFLLRIIHAEERVRAEMNALVESQGEVITQMHRPVSPLQLELGVLRIDQVRSKFWSIAPAQTQVLCTPSKLRSYADSLLDNTSKQPIAKREIDARDEDDQCSNQDQVAGDPEVSTSDQPSGLDLLAIDYSDAYRTRISSPYKAKQELHVTYNLHHARYEGLPPAWRALNIQFGLPLEAVPKRVVDGYDAKIPAVLQMMKERLIESGGANIEGIFRLAPDRDECATVKRAINDGTFNGCSDLNVIANLIKVWFRELPRGLFNMVPERHIYQVCELEEGQEILESVNKFPPMHRSLVLWVLDLMVEIVRNEHVNKMSARNMAIVMAPNLFTITSENPMCALTMSQKVVDFTLAMLKARMQAAETKSPLGLQSREEHDALE